MNIPLIIGLILFVLAAVLLFKIIKKIISLAFSIIGVAIIILVVLMILKAADSSSLEEKFSSSNNLFVLKGENGILAAYDSEPFEPMLLDDPTELENALENNPKKLMKDRYKIIVIPLSTISELEFETVEFDGSTYSRKEVFTLFEKSDESNTKAEIFRAIVEDKLLKGYSSDELIKLSNAEKLEVYEKTIAFKGFSLR